MKTMLVTTQQISRRHSLDAFPLGLKISDAPLERQAVPKLLVVHLDSHVKCDQHINQLLNPCYGTLTPDTKQKLKNFTDFKLRKYLVETLILSKLRVRSIEPIPE